MTKSFAPGSTVSPEVFCLVKKLESVVVGKKYSADGEVFVCRRGEVPFELPLEIEDYEEVELKDAHIIAMKNIYLAVQEIHTNPHRKVPLTREELECFGITKKISRQLCDLGLLQEHLVPLMKKSSILDKDGNPTMRHVGAKACVMFTNQGRAYVRSFINPDYGVAGKEHWDGVKKAADEIRANTAKRAGMYGQGISKHDAAPELCSDAIAGGHHGGVQPVTGELGQSHRV